MNKINQVLNSYVIMIKIIVAEGNNCSFSLHFTFQDIVGCLIQLMVTTPINKENLSLPLSILETNFWSRSHLPCPGYPFSTWS